MHRATVVAGIGLAVTAIAGCGSGGRLLSSAESSTLNEQLSQVSQALNDGDCTAAENDLTDFQNRVADLSGVNSTLVQNLNQGASTIQQLTSTKCSDVTATTPAKTAKKKKAQTTTTSTQTDTNTNTDTFTTTSDTSTVNTNTYTTETYTDPDQYSQTSTTGGSGLDNGYTDTTSTTDTTTEPSTTATTPTTDTTTSTSSTDTTDGTDTTGGTGGGSILGSASRYSDAQRYANGFGHRHHSWRGGGF